MIHTPFITVAMVCKRFERRLCWSMQSLFEQITPQPLAVDIVAAPGGSPDITDVVSRFGSLRVCVSKWVDPRLSRGDARNLQLARCTTPWLMFTDADMVWHPEWFARLRDILNQNPSFNGMYTSGRRSSDVDVGNDIIRLNDPLTVTKPFDKLKPVCRNRGRACGTGYAQIINVRNAPHGGYYDHNTDEREGIVTGPLLMPSDIAFRRRINNTVVLDKWFSVNALHINHRRDSKENRHLEEQR